MSTLLSECNVEGAGQRGSVVVIRVHWMKEFVYVVYGSASE